MTQLWYMYISDFFPYTYYLPRARWNDKALLSLWLLWLDLTRALLLPLDSIQLCLELPPSSSSSCRNQPSISPFSRWFFQVFLVCLLPPGLAVSADVHYTGDAAITSSKLSYNFSKHSVGLQETSSFVCCVEQRMLNNALSSVHNAWSDDVIGRDKISAEHARLVLPSVRINLVNDAKERTDTSRSSHVLLHVISSGDERSLGLWGVTFLR